MKKLLLTLGFSLTTFLMGTQISVVGEVFTATW